MTSLLKKDDSFFIAGHNGMVGKSVVKKLLEKGYGDRKYGGELITKTRSELDLTCYKDVFNWFTENKPKIVIIAAAKVGGIYANYKNPYSFISENLKIAQNIIESAWLNGARRLLFLGSSCIYPKNSIIPIKEEKLLSSYLEKTNESYAIAKIAGIKLCEAIRKQHNFDAIALMPTNLYGPGDNYHSKDSHVMASLLKKFILAKRENQAKVECWGTGKPLREFLYVDDLGEACIHALEKWNPSSKNSPKDNNGDELCFLNIGSGDEISIKELANKIAYLTKYKGEIVWDKSKPDGTYRKKLDISRAETIGWQSKTELDLGIKNVIEEINRYLDSKDKYKLQLKNF